MELATKHLQSKKLPKKMRYYAYDLILRISFSSKLNGSPVKSLFQVIFERSNAHIFIKKNMKASFLLLCFCVFQASLYGQQLETVYPDNFSGDVSSIQMHDSGVGYATLECGYLLRTSDGGQNWESLSLPISQQGIFPSGYFLDEMDPSKVIYYSIREMLYTEDGFATTIDVTPENGGLINGFVQLENGRWLISGTHVLYSDDQGQSWTQSATSEAGGRGLLYHQGVVYAGSGSIYRSTNGGESFTKVLDDDINPRKIIGRENVLYAMTLDKSLYESTDNGLNWQQVSTQNFNGLPNGLSFYDANTIMTNTVNTLTYSTDGGRNWEVQFIFIDGFINTVSVQNDGQILIGSTGSQIYNSEGLFDIFFQRNGYGEDFNCVASNENQVMAVGELGALAYSSDGGENWTYNIVDDANLSRVTYIGEEAFVANEWGQVLHVRPDLSLEVVLETGVNVEDIVYSKADGLAYVVAGNTIYKSTDKGQNWFEHHTFPSPPSRLKADFAGNLFVLVDGKVWSAFNASNDFEIYTEGPSGITNVIDFLVLRFSTIYLLTPFDVYLSTDEGASFIEATAPYNGKRLHELSQDRVLCLGTNGEDADLFVADKGTLDFDFTISTCAALARDAFWDEPTETFWVCGKGREIQRANLENTTTSVQFEVADTRLLVYPNPTADFLQKREESNTISHWAIYDMSGRLIKEERAVQLHVGDLASGTYIVRLNGQHTTRFMKL